MTKFIVLDRNFLADRPDDFLGRRTGSPLVEGLSE